MQCKLFLENPENNDSTHVANFYFTVNDSGITKRRKRNTCGITR